MRLWKLALIRLPLCGRHLLPQVGEGGGQGSWAPSIPRPGRVRVERENGAAHILEGHFVVVRGADAKPGAFDDGAGDRAEVGSPMHAALDGDEALDARVDA